MGDIPKVERLNNLSINVFGYEDESLHPLYLTESPNDSPINLLLVTEEEDGQTKTHFCWIKDFDRLCYDRNKHKAKTFFCLRCFSSFNTKASLNRHDDTCKEVTAGRPARVVMPKEGETLCFCNHQKMLKVSMNSLTHNFLHAVQQNVIPFCSRLRSTELPFSLLFSCSFL